MSKFGHCCGYLIVFMNQNWWELNLTLLDTVCCNRYPVLWKCTAVITHQYKCKNEEYVKQQRS